ncbi:C-type lectin domain family 4 member E isoform X2 [Betta splendens]|uniref:C-type lectin domain family 4 member E isoform X2 n=1 Tax=Betta splendens TaxID=158456 RepID=A0A6P7NWW5_BETSP|nr:C-type lectin domain family 4 member E isoform X2 [Betta splendens]
MEDGDNYSSLQEFSEEPATGGNRLIVQHADGLKRCLQCRSLAARLMAVGLLLSLCTNVVLIVLWVDALQRVASSDSSLRLKVNLVQKRYVQLCEDYAALGQSCSRTVQPCAECPAGWRQLSDQCYYFSSDKLDWLRSKASCEEMGGHLTILHSMEQHDAVEEEAKRIGGFDFHYWIGLSDTGKEGDWRWVDNTILQHKYWDEHSSEPDDHQSGGEHGEDCATLNSQSKTWFDVPCDFLYKRICQMGAVQLH